jgi:hypothetical protein
MMSPPPPPPPLPGGDPAGGLAIMPTMYVGFYRATVALLSGNYGPAGLAGNAVAVAAANISSTVSEIMLNTADTASKVYIVTVPGPIGAPVVKTLYHRQLYRSLPGCRHCFGRPGQRVWHRNQWYSRTRIYEGVHTYRSVRAHYSVTAPPPCAGRVCGTPAPQFAHTTATGSGRVGSAWNAM